VSFSIAHQDKRHKKAQIMNIYTTRNTTQWNNKYTPPFDGNCHNQGLWRHRNVT
jgi:hypothetical protein